MEMLDLIRDTSKKSRIYRDGSLVEVICLGMRGQRDYSEKEEENKKIVD